MALRHPRQKNAAPAGGDTENDLMVKTATYRTRTTCPQPRRPHPRHQLRCGWFHAACLKLGCCNLAGADFGITHKDYIRDWAPDRITLLQIHDNIGEFPE
jgi:hypothetical protein